MCGELQVHKRELQQSDYESISFDAGLRHF